MRSIIQLPKSAILLCVALLCLLPTGCAESDLSPSGSGNSQVDAGDQGDTHNPERDAETIADADTSSNGDSVEYAPCVIDGSAPWEDVAWGDCLAETVLDFGSVGAGQTVARLVRVDNQGTVSLRLNEALLDDANFNVQARRYSAGGAPVATDTTLPDDLAGEDAYFFEISVTGPGIAGAFAADVFEILLNPATSTGSETISIPLLGAYDSCAAHTADCDGDPTNGCEANIAGDALNCGGCGIVCAMPDGHAACVDGMCVVDSCLPQRADCDADPANGCETDLRSVEHCGACGEVCEFDNGRAQCGAGACTFEGCVAPFSNCDGVLTNGCETDTDSSLEHCGGCNLGCAFAGASASCNGGSCEFLKCDADTVDLNNDLSDGCECQITDANDVPDSAGLDTNCDGIDGDASRGIFVATTGSDTAAGTRDAPLKTISKALTLAASVSGLDHIYVATGQYAEQVTLANGVSIFGGYDATDNWKRIGGAPTTIFYDGPGERIAVRGVGITSATVLGMLEVRTAHTTVASQSNYALHCKNCSALVIQNSKITAGNGGNGAAGSNGLSGASAFGSGSNGGIGGNGQGDGANYGLGGTGGASGCGRTGGTGGRGGLRGENPGLNGGTGISGTPGGAGGLGDYGFLGATGKPGKPGSTGATAATGQNGSGGAGGQVLNDFWRGESGSDGTHGAHGNGGGGGGGGGGQAVGNSSWNGSGNGGGGGGGGGCGGRLGTGGSAGGGSFGLFLVNSTGITLTNNTITSGNGGNGGRGGSGGSGSAGGTGMRGGNADTGEVGAGGAGGNGSRGGNGGAGGGGAGGNSYGVYRQNTTLTLPAGNLITHGNSGTGGSSAGNAGSNGLAADF